MKSLLTHSLFSIFLTFWVSAPLFADVATPTGGITTPTLTVTTQGPLVTVTWSAVEDADGYTLYLAPYPEASVIYDFDMENSLTISAELYEASYYIAVQAYNDSETSHLSNVEYFIQQPPDDFSPGDEPQNPGDENSGDPGGDNTGTDSYEKSGAYEQDGDSVDLSGQTFVASESDQSGVYVYNGGTFSLSDSSISKTGDTSSEDASNFYGLNAVVLAEESSTVTLSNCSLDSSADGSNGAFAYGEGTHLIVDSCTISTEGNSSRGVDATYGGIVTVTNSTISTLGDHCAAIATDRYEDNDPPTIIADNISGTTAGEGSPGIYCTGTFSVSNSNFTATGSEAAAIEGLNSITLTDSDIAGADRWGVIIYQSTSGDSTEGMGTFDMTGGTLTNNSTGPLFMVCNTEATIILDDVETISSGDVLIRATDASSGDDNINSDWGASGGNVTFQTTNQSLTGTVSCNGLSTIDLTLSGTSDLSGAVEIESGGEVSITLEESCTWLATADSTVTVLDGVVIGDDGKPTNVDAATGITITYGSGDGLSGTYALASGGYLAQ